MEKNPDDRFASAEEMEKVVGAILSGADATRLLQRISASPLVAQAPCSDCTAISVLLVAAIVLTYSIRGTRPGAREETRPKTERAARQSAEVAFAVRDDYQNKGIGTTLLTYLTYLAKRQGLLGFKAEVLVENRPMMDLFEKMGFDIKKRVSEGVYELDMMFK